MNDVFNRLNKNEEPVVKAVAILFSDGTIDSMDQITNCALSSTDDGNDEIIISGKYHALLYFRPVKAISQFACMNLAEIF